MVANENSRAEATEDDVLPIGGTFNASVQMATELVLTEAGNGNGCLIRGVSDATERAVEQEPNDEPLDLRFNVSKLTFVRL